MKDRNYKSAKHRYASRESMEFLGEGGAFADIYLTISPITFWITGVIAKPVGYDQVAASVIAGGIATAILTLILGSIINAIFAFETYGQNTIQSHGIFRFLFYLYFRKKAPKFGEDKYITLDTLNIRFSSELNSAIVISDKIKKDHSYCLNKIHEITRILENSVLEERFLIKLKEIKDQLCSQLEILNSQSEQAENCVSLINKEIVSTATAILDTQKYISICSSLAAKEHLDYEIQRNEEILQRMELRISELTKSLPQPEALTIRYNAELELLETIKS